MGPWSSPDSVTKKKFHYCSCREFEPHRLARSLALYWATAAPGNLSDNFYIFKHFSNEQKTILRRVYEWNERVCTSIIIRLTRLFGTFNSTSKSKYGCTYCACEILLAVLRNWNKILLRCKFQQIICLALFYISKFSTTELQVGFLFHLLHSRVTKREINVILYGKCILRLITQSVLTLCYPEARKRTTTKISL